MIARGISPMTHRQGACAAEITAEAATCARTTAYRGLSRIGALACVARIRTAPQAPAMVRSSQEKPVFGFPEGSGVLRRSLRRLASSPHLCGRGVLRRIPAHCWSFDRSSAPTSSAPEGRLKAVARGRTTARRPERSL